MELKKNILYVILIYALTIVWLITHWKLNSLAKEQVDSQYLLILSVITVFFILIIGYFIVGLGKIRKTGFFLDLIIIDIPALFLLCLNILYFAGVNVLIEYQNCFGICTIVGGLLLSCDINRMINHTKERITDL